MQCSCSIIERRAGAVLEGASQNEVPEISNKSRDQLLHECKKVKVCTASQVAHQAVAYPGFSSMKQLRVFLLPPGWDASPSQGTSQH